MEKIAIKFSRLQCAHSSSSSSPRCLASLMTMLVPPTPAARFCGSLGAVHARLFDMLNHKAIALFGLGVSSRAFASIKFDLSHYHFSPPQPLQPPANFSHSSAASKLFALYQPCANPLATNTAVSFTPTMSPLIKSIASTRLKLGDSAVVELPCAAEIVDTIAEFPYKLSTLGHAPHWSIDISDILKAATPRTSLIVLRSLNPASGALRSPDFFSSLLSALQSQNPSRKTMIVVDDTHLPPPAFFARETDINVAFLSDFGASLGAPRLCCAIRCSDAAIHAVARGFPLQASCAPIIDRLSSPEAIAPNFSTANAALFRAWMQREATRLVCSPPHAHAAYARCLVSLAPGVEIDPRRFYSELERRGFTRVGRGSDWCLDDSSFMVEWGHLSSEALDSGLQAISSALDVWASTSDSSLGLSSIY
jgi:hypothetical protein